MEWIIRMWWIRDESKSDLDIPIDIVVNDRVMGDDNVCINLDILHLKAKEMLRVLYDVDSLTDLVEDHVYQARLRHERRIAEAECTATGR